MHYNAKLNRLASERFVILSSFSSNSIWTIVKKQQQQNSVHLYQYTQKFLQRYCVSNN